MTNNKRICIIRSEYANLYSVENALKALGYTPDISNNIEDLDNYDLYILPGVGSFEQVKGSLEENNLFSKIQEIAKTGKPVLGICLGYQLLFEKSTESKDNNIIEGLGLVKGQIELLPKDKIKRIPHIGWNKLTFSESEFSDKLTAGLDKDNSFVYFVHSYYAQQYREEDLTAYTRLGKDNEIVIPAIIQKDNVCGMQFHPERSGQTGLQLLDNFIKLSE